MGGEHQPMVFYWTKRLPLGTIGNEHLPMVFIEPNNSSSAPWAVNTFLWFYWTEQLWLGTMGGEHLPMVFIGYT